MVCADNLAGASSEEVRRIGIPVIGLVSYTNRIPEQLAAIVDGTVLAIFEVKVEAVAI